MRLKSLEITGFKSFAKKSTFSFDSQITAIVGPNGSGKSNVAEAFRFVLGEQSIKSMRGKRGEDLIFNGNTASGRQNKAAVKVILDNVNRTLDIDFDEVSISRVVHRDGVNDYFINNSVVRLKDIIELLSNASIGSTGHHIISQGEADRILNASIKDRRAMFEDALGLRSFQYKKIESERKLEKTEENLKQVESLRKEIAPHLKFLKKQVDKIEKSKELKDKLVLFYKDYLARENFYLRDKKEILEKEGDPLKNQVSKISIELEKYRKEIESDIKEDAKTSKLVDLEDNLHLIRNKRNELVREMGQIEGEIKSLEKVSQKEIKEVTVKISDVEELRDSIEQKTILRQGFERQAEETNFLKGIIQEIKDMVSNFIKERKGASDSLFGSSFAEDLTKLKTKKKELEEQIKNLEKKEKDLETQISHLRKEIESSKSEMLDTERKIFELQTKKSELENNLNRLALNRESLNRDEEEFKRELKEAIVLAGREAVNYETSTVTKSEALNEEREKQLERRRELEKLKIRVEEMGGGSSDDILKEYQESNERDEFLVREIEDLEKSAASLKQLIKELEGEINKRFKDGVNSINIEFQKFFELMFGGGEAYLKVVKPDIRKKKDMDTDLSFAFNNEEGMPSEAEAEGEAEEGIDIHVSLPRKKIKGLMMLSGGERALTSIALIFAMSAVNPPPFIILDETDAALDEANSRKYGDMIKSLSKQSQLILITHNRETMSRADTIYGVTMLQGSSELLSIKFEDGVQYAK
jgi:chromosome segregation protein